MYNRLHWRYFSNSSSFLANGPICGYLVSSLFRFYRSSWFYKPTWFMVYEKVGCVFLYWAYHSKSNCNFGNGSMELYGSFNTIHYSSDFIIIYFKNGIKFIIAKSTESQINSHSKAILSISKLTISFGHHFFSFAKFYKLFTFCFTYKVFTY